MVPTDQDRSAVQSALDALAAESTDFGTPLPDLDDGQRNQLAALGPLYREWNAHINVIPRKDIDQFFIRHVLHSLAIARVLRPESGARILDGQFSAVQQAVGVNKNNPEAYEWLKGFVEDAKASGMIAGFIETHGVQGKLSVAPPS